MKNTYYTTEVEIDSIPFTVHWLLLHDGGHITQAVFLQGSDINLIDIIHNLVYTLIDSHIEALPRDSDYLRSHIAPDMQHVY